MSAAVRGREPVAERHRGRAAEGLVSAGCIYTLAYLVRSELKRQGIHRPEQTLRVRQTLDIVLSMVTVAGISHKRMVSGNSDPAFDDIEDSFQYQCAVQNKCDALVTINLNEQTRNIVY